jgi:hypothetical protein
MSTDQERNLKQLTEQSEDRSNDSFDSHWQSACVLVLEDGLSRHSRKVTVRRPDVRMNH